MQLAQVNLARVRAPLDDPMMAEFVANLDPVNALAEATPGFVWRLQDDGGNATNISYNENSSIIVNLSVWQDAEALRSFTYRSHHTDFLKRRREWFTRMDIFVALWWVQDGHRPTVLEARERLGHLTEHGPMPHAFTFARVFEPLAH
ncbi:DUF3291 domain-containing protein [Deinococcus frigens]|uniref:DUF3291 domain-containing protein n=1 Tax=Deinococcus frigens TaxID=249403 RepID=UPI000495B8E4|nr:DUF3291 domain-containing protein [Deinococcus frigens]